MNDLFPSFFESRKPAASPAKVADRAKALAPAPRTLAPLATLARAEGQIGGGTPQTLARLATLAGVDGQIGAGALGRNIQPATLILTPHQRGDRPDCETWRARAASLEAAGVPIEWGEPFARLLCGAPPRGFEPHRWASVAEGPSIFAEQWAAQALRLGWSAEDVFGLDETAPAARHDRKGVGWFMADGRRVVALDADGADIETDRGVRQRYYRRSDDVCRERRCKEHEEDLKP